jgi:threonine dehydrogenase-like Zn-dependent dehydrogenase
MAELLDLLARWGEHPERIVTHRFGLADTGDAYAVAAAGASGKVVITWEDA